MGLSNSSSPLRLRYLMEQRRTAPLVLYTVALLSFLFIPSTAGCPYTSIYSFGDSLTDTGNWYFSSRPPPFWRCFLPPYGTSYFGPPSKRCSDGRLIIDFIAEYLGIPLVKPYLGIKNGEVKNWNIKEGVNFAVDGATALDVNFFEERGIHSVSTNYSLTVQLGWFKELLPSLCNSSSSKLAVRKFLQSHYFWWGEIGGNDISRPLLLQRSLEEIKTYVPPLIEAISSTIRELIKIGAQTLIVPGNFPIGCYPSYLTFYQSKYTNDYDEAGCLKWLNKFIEYFNGRLQYELNQLRRLHPHANIIYADYYNALLPLYHSATKFGLKACCGTGDSYNFNPSKRCGDEGVKACDDRSKYISWDGLHLTEAAYRFISSGLLEGSYTTPKFDALCMKNVTLESFSSHMFE